MYYLCQVPEGWWWWQWHFSLIFSSVLAHFLFFLRRVLSIRMYSCINGCRDPVAGGPRTTSGSHLQIGFKITCCLSCLIRIFEKAESSFHRKHTTSTQTSKQQAQTTLLLQGRVQHGDKTRTRTTRPGTGSHLRVQLKPKGLGGYNTRMASDILPAGRAFFWGGVCE